MLPTPHFGKVNMAQSNSSASEHFHRVATWTYHSRPLSPTRDRSLSLLNQLVFILSIDAFRCPEIGHHPIMNSFLPCSPEGMSGMDLLHVDCSPHVPTSWTFSRLLTAARGPCAPFRSRLLGISAIFYLFGFRLNQRKAHYTGLIFPIGWKPFGVVTK